MGASIVKLAMEAAAPVLGVALIVYASSTGRQIVRHVAAARAAAGLSALPYRHFVDFARIAEAYVEATSQGGQVWRTYVSSTVGAALLVAGVLLLLMQLDLPK
jgi:hypothetical protein